MRRTHLRKHENILKRTLIHVAGWNLGLLMRDLFGVGSPRSLQGRLAAFLCLVLMLLARIWERLEPGSGSSRRSTQGSAATSVLDIQVRWLGPADLGWLSATGC